MIISYFQKAKLSLLFRFDIPVLLQNIVDLKFWKSIFYILLGKYHVTYAFRNFPPTNKQRKILTSLQSSEISRSRDAMARFSESDTSPNKLISISETVNRNEFDVICLFRIDSNLINTKLYRLLFSIPEKLVFLLNSL